LPNLAIALALAKALFLFLSQRGQHVFPAKASQSANLAKFT